MKKSPISETNSDAEQEQSYNDARAERLVAGADWPTAQALGQAYGHWLAVVRAAMRFWFDGGPQRVASGHEHATGRRPGYQPEEIVRAIAKFSFQFGVWPTEWEYTEWRKLQVDAWRRSGQPGRRLPNLKQIRAAFDDFDRAVAVAQAWATGGDPHAD